MTGLRCKRSRNWSIRNRLDWRDRSQPYSPHLSWRSYAFTFFEASSSGTIDKFHFTFFLFHSWVKILKRGISVEGIIFQRLLSWLSL
uniref:Uncharacterized protein n=1 Tax=Utricularia reniformis TaxID=192314 RepID=A0A1Y0B4I3_9LAMI|nr:hypothetical protein AEK19_MT2184 [Utricularia reniformis]ART32331.1 hypothetical protein AEK19_MT2184 [Utricularia reniformis]